MTEYEKLTSPEALDEIEHDARDRFPGAQVTLYCEQVRALVDALRTARQGDAWGKANIGCIKEDLGVTSPKMDDLYDAIRDLKRKAEAGAR